MGKGGRQVEATRIFFGDHNHVTGARARGPVWRGPAPRKPISFTGRSLKFAEANAAIEERLRPSLGFMPDSNLGRLLLDPKVKRPLRRAIIAAVQAPPSRRRTKLQRRVGAQLSALGVQA